MKPCNVLIVDDSRTMRAVIASALGGDPGVHVVGEAGDPFEAREAIKRLNPDVVTLDIEMPRMNGLDFLERLMRLRPTPVIVISSLTERGAESTIRALELGAVDCVAKPSVRNGNSLADLSDRVKCAAKAHVKAPVEKVIRAKTEQAAYRPDGRVVAVGSSMGGVEALSSLFSTFPENCPPTVVTQHMPSMFTKSFADRLNRTCRPTVIEATDGAPLVAGVVYVAPGGASHLEVRGKEHPRCHLVKGELVSGHRPSVDVLFRSVRKAFGGKAVGVILTGMGRDGAEGLLELREGGAETIGQDEASSLVYGMPRAAYDLGAVGVQLPLRSIGDHILSITNTNSKR